MNCHVVTFYSFKGGVGRTLLLANVGARLAATGRKVLLWDLDLEAPGLHRIEGLTPKPQPKSGFLEWLREWEAGHGQALPGEREKRKLRNSIRKAPAAENLFLLQAHGEKADFATLYESIDWHAWLVKQPEQGLKLFRGLLDGFAAEGYHFILLDARTGLTDLGGMMAAVLPHTTVLVGNYGSQNFHGLAAIYRALQRAVEDKVPARGDLGPLNRLVVASPVPPVEAELHAARSEAWDREFVVPGTETRVEVPFTSKLLFKEELLVLGDPQGAAAAAYRQVAERIESLYRKQQQEQALAREADYAWGEAAAPRSPKQTTREVGDRFEDAVAKLLSLLGYSVQREQLIDGNLVDLIARKAGGFSDELFLVECKDHQEAVPKKRLETFCTWLAGPEARAMDARGMYVARRYAPAALTYAKAQRIVTVTPEELERRLFDFGPYLARLRRAFEESALARDYIPQKVLLEADPRRQDVELIDHSLKWADGTGGRLWLLLGDYGTGKSSFFKRFTYELARRHHEDPENCPAPLAIDLKEFPNAVSLETLLQEHLRRHADWHGNPEILLHLLESGRLLLVLDAFDEMGTAAAGRSIEDQFRQLVSPTRRRGRGRFQARANRVLLTCRTHFFRDQQQVKQVATGGDSLISEDSPLGKVAREFDATIDELRLFDHGQIRRFLENRLGEERAAEAQAFIDETYDLKSLAPRPVLLEMIVRSLPQLMEKGGEVTPAGLYNEYTDLWLKEHSGRNLQTGYEQRRLLLERLAFELWGLEQHRIHHKQLSRVIAEFPPELLRGFDPERVDLELRTAAFLIRPADGFYSFSHKSFREFFYARYLLRALREGTEAMAAALATAPLTPECSEFLYDLMGERDRESLPNVTKSILSAPYRPRVSENTLRLAYQIAARTQARRRKDGREDLTAAVRALIPSGARLESAQLAEEKMAYIWLERARLNGANLTGIEFSGAQLESSDLSEAKMRRARLTCAALPHSNLSCAELDQSDLADADLAGASATGSSLRWAKLCGLRAGLSDFSKADLTAVVAVNADFRAADLGGACFHGARLAGAMLDEARIEAVDFTAATGPLTPSSRFSLSPPARPAWWLATGGYAVRSIAFSPDGGRIVAVGEDGSGCIWDLKSGRPLICLRAHTSGINGAAFSPNGHLIVTAGTDFDARVWDARSGQLMLVLEGHSRPVTAAAFSPNGRFLVTASDDRTARLWDAESGAQIRVLRGHRKEVIGAMFSQDGHFIVTTGRDQSLRLWEVASGRNEFTTEIKGDWLAAVSAWSESARFATADFNVAYVWDAPSVKRLFALEGHTEPVTKVAFSVDGRLVATFAHDLTVRIWDASSGGIVSVFGGLENDITEIVFSPDGRHVALAGYDDLVRIINVRAGKQTLVLGGRFGWPASAAFSSDGRRVATIDTAGRVRMWNVQTGEQLRAIDGGPRGAVAAAFSRESDGIVFAGADGTVQFSGAGEHGVVYLEDCGDWLTSAAFSPDARYVVAADNRFRTHVWDVRTGKRVRVFDASLRRTRIFKFSPNGRLLLTCHGTIATMWDVGAGKRVREFGGHEGVLCAVSFSDDGTRILTAGLDNVSRVWDVQSGGELLALATPLSAAALSPDSRNIVTAAHDGVARLWDASSGKQLLVLDGHTDGVNSACFSPDGRHILTTSFDSTTRLWDAATGRQLLVLFGASNGWAAIDPATGRYRGEGEALEVLQYYDPEERSEIRTLWPAADVPWMRMEEPEE